MRWQKESAKPGPAETEIIMIVAWYNSNGLTKIIGGNNVSNLPAEVMVIGRWKIGTFAKKSLILA
jgi:hypothetical protein